MVSSRSWDRSRKASYRTREETKLSGGISCGIFVLGMVHAHLTQDFSFCSLRVNKAYLNFFRLRTAYKVMNHIEITVTQRGDKATVIAQEIKKGPYQVKRPYKALESCNILKVAEKKSLDCLIVIMRCA